VDPSGDGQQILWLDGPVPVLKDLARVCGAASLREAVHGPLSGRETIAQHQQRRKAGGIPESVRARIDRYACGRGGRDCGRKLADRHHLALR